MKINLSDNKATISIAYTRIHHDKTKHFEIDRQFIKEKLTNGTIFTPFMKFAKQLADVLTKGNTSRSYTLF